MRKDNPHISKRRGGRKPTHRRFSLQAFHSNKHKLHQGSEVTSAEHENEASRSPEESTNSVDVVPGGGAGEGEGGLSGGGGGVEVIRARSTSLSSRAASVGHRWSAAGGERSTMKVAIEIIGKEAARRS